MPTLSHPLPSGRGPLGRVVAQAGGRIVWCWHQAKPRYYLWSLGFWLRDHGLEPLARVAEWRPVYGVLKLFLEVTLPPARWCGRGEVVRVGIERRPGPLTQPSRAEGADRRGGSQ